MASLGALTKGDRRAASGSDLSEFDIDSRFGRQSLKRLLNCMAPDPPYIPSKGSNAVLDLYQDNESFEIQNERDRQVHALKKAKMSLAAIGLESSDTQKNNSMKFFLNRIAALTVAEQNLVFGLFTSTMDDVVAEAKATGEYEASVEQIRATSVELLSPPQILAHDKSNTAAPTKLMTFKLDRGVSFEGVCKIVFDMMTESSNEDTVEVQSSVALSGFYVSKRLIMGRTLILFAKRKIHLMSDDEADTANRIDYDPRGLMVITRPNTGTNPCEMPTNDLLTKYNLLVSVNALNTLFKGMPNIDCAAFASVAQQNHSSCYNLWHQTFHGSNTFSDQIGFAPRLSKLAMVTGSVLHCFPALQQSVSMMMKQSDRSLKIIRVQTSSNKQQYVGVKFPFDDKVIFSLISILDSMNNSDSVEDVVDETPSNIQRKSVTWITTEPTTMKSFFKPKDGVELKLKRKSSSTCTPIGSKAKRMESKSSSTKVSKSTITSFFQRK